MLHFPTLAALMNYRSFIVRCAAVFLLLVFSQKTGIDLLLHNALHTAKVSEKTPGQKDRDNTVNYSCSCIDNFLTPYIETDEPAVAIVVKTEVIIHECLPAQLSLRSLTYVDLRGPPAIML